MIALEKYLLENGYKKYKLDLTKKVKDLHLELEQPGKHTISTMVNIDYRYIKGDFENDKPPLNYIPQIIIGLYEKNKPVTLISPRPNYLSNDNLINRRLAIGDFEKILEEIFNHLERP